MQRFRWVTAGLALLAVVARVPDAAAQAVTLGAIEGTISDETGAKMPGATATLTSPALQVPQVTTITDATGHYRFGDLRVGIYRIQFELSGFQSVVRDGIDLPVGFTARVDQTLKIGAVEETLTVTGQSPIVDITNTRGGQTIFTDEIQKTLPTSGGYTDLVRLTPGLNGGVGGGSGNPGQLGLRGLVNPTSYGVAANGNTSRTVMLEEFEMFGNNTPGSFTDTEQMDVKTYGNTADIGKPGPAINFVYKSGGNQFHGTAGYSYMGDKLQGNNLDATLRSQGTQSPDGLLRYNDVHANLGGRIIPDKVWFFTSLRARGNQRSVAGFVSTPGGSPAYPTATQNSEVGKVSYQINPKYQLEGFYFRDDTRDHGAAFSGYFGGNATTVPFEASSQQLWVPKTGFVQWRGLPTSNLTFELQVGRSQYDSNYLDQPGYENVPSTYDRTSQLYTGAAINTSVSSAGERFGHAGFNLYRGSLSLFPTESHVGRHQFKVGFWVKDSRPVSGALNHPAGNYLLVFDTVAEVPHQPVEIVTFNFPIEATNVLVHPSVYGSDSWQIGQRLTLNLGLRWEQQHSYVPAQSREVGQFARAGSFPNIEVGRWTQWAPRAAAAWNPPGKTTTVFKATYGRYVVETNDALNPFASTYNPLGTVATDYRWHDLNHNNNYDPGEVNLDVNGTDFVSIAGGISNTLINPNFLPAHVDEATASFERELVPTIGARVLYVYKRLTGDFDTINTARPYSAFNIPLTRRDPGADGLLGTADDAGSVTIWDYDAAYRGAAFVVNSVLNRAPDHADTAQTIEVAVSRRLANGWSLTSSFDATKNHRWLVGTYQSPNDAYFPLDRTWSKVFKLGGSYMLPWQISFGGTLSLLSGVPGQRTYVFRAADPDGGTPLRQQTTVTLRLEPFGAHTGPVRPDLGLRLAKVIRTGSREIEFMLDALNSTNGNAAQAITYVSGPTFGRITQIPSPRQFQVGVQYRF